MMKVVKIAIGECVKANMRMMNELRYRQGERGPKQLVVVVPWRLACLIAM
jgi:hypothetical protein